MAYSETEICNIAIVKMGDDDAFNSLDEDHKKAKICNRLYPIMRDALLQSFKWNFAMTRATLSRDGDTPASEFDYFYQLPADCLRVVEVYQATGRWRISGRLLETDDTEVDIVYIKKETDTGKYSPLFVDILSDRIAAFGSRAVGTTDGTTERLFQIYKENFKQAKIVDSKEGTPDTLRVDGIISGSKTPRKTRR